jgi:hypothetical protein
MCDGAGRCPVRLLLGSALQNEIADGIDSGSEGWKYHRRRIILVDERWSLEDHARHKSVTGIAWRFDKICHPLKIHPAFPDQSAPQVSR